MTQEQTSEVSQTSEVLFSPEPATRRCAFSMTASGSSCGPHCPCGQWRHCPDGRCTARRCALYSDQRRMEWGVNAHR